MKIQCDVCGKEEATIFCCADEAALCNSCDYRVHKANKLAGKHRRFSLLHPTSAQAAPVCDVCQEKRGYIFCQEDRAILCKDCDESIHGANNLTMKHNRFLLAGARLSPHPLSFSDSDSNPNTSEEKLDKKIETSSKINKEKESTITGSGSSISEYLTKVCPGWHVEDLLVDDAAIVAATAMGKQMTPYLAANDLEASTFGPPMWVPQPASFAPATINPCETQWMGSVNARPKVLTERDCWYNTDDLFTVPEILPKKASMSNKRPRSPVWYY